MPPMAIALVEAVSCKKCVVKPFQTIEREHIEEYRLQVNPRPLKIILYEEVLHLCPVLQNLSRVGHTRRIGDDPSPSSRRNCNPP